jgi:sugar lactone lactonase YvrE
MGLEAEKLFARDDSVRRQQLRLLMPKTWTGRAVGIGVLLLAAYLFAWPVPVEPVKWSAPPAPALDGPYEPNQKLSHVEWLQKGHVQGPEAIAIDSQGRIYTGTSNGQIVRVAADGSSLDTVASPGGRPFGVAFDAGGTLFVCDSPKGLLSISPQGQMTELSSEQGGVPYGFADDLDIGSDGTVYFTDASSKFGANHYFEDILEHGANGRFLAWRPSTRSVDLLIHGMHFANGVALNSDQSFVLINETASYRVLRYWLSGPKKGNWDVFIDNLPGFPDNITFSKTRGIFWLALFAPRDAIADLLAPHPFLRKIVGRLPTLFQPAPKRHAFVLGLDESGRVVQNLQDPAPGSFSPITSVRENGGYLYLGSLLRDAIGKVAAP